MINAPRDGDPLPPPRSATPRRTAVSWCRWTVLGRSGRPNGDWGVGQEGAETPFYMFGGDERVLFMAWLVVDPCRARDTTGAPVLTQIRGC